MITDLSKEEVYEVITKVANNHKNKSFSYFEKDDIIQEVWIIALDRLPLYDNTQAKVSDPKKALEHWLNTVVSNRLANLKRDKYTAPQKQKKGDPHGIQQRKRINLMHPLCIDDITEEAVGIIDDIGIPEDHWSTILENLNEELLDILESLLSGEDINCYYRNKLYSEIKEILHSCLPDV